LRLWHPKSTFGGGEPGPGISYVTAANARGCRAAVLGPLEAVPAKVINWDGQGFGVNLTILPSAKTGFWTFREDVH
jgi:hypothetical protein